MRGFLKLAIIFIPYYISLKMIVVKENIEKRLKTGSSFTFYLKKKNVFIKNTFFLIYIANPHPDCIPV